MLPFVSLDAATSTGPGDHKDLETVLTQHRAEVQVTGSPASLDLSLEGSFDAVTWYTLATTTLTSASFAFAPFESVPSPVRFVRANLTALSGGTSPTVTVTIGSA